MLSGISPAPSTACPPWIRPVAAPVADPGMAPPPPQDAVAPCTVDTTAMLRAMRVMPRVPKQDHVYDVRAHAFGPDGSTYIGYREDRGSLGYVGRAGAEGKVRWEAAFPNLQNVGVDDAGRCHVITDGEHVTLDAAGTETGRTPLPTRLSGHWVDPATGDVVGLSGDYHLVLPPGVDGPSGRVYGLEVSRDGRQVVTHTDESFFGLTSRGVAWQRPNPPVERKGFNWTAAERAWPMPDGGTLYLVCQHEDVTVPHHPFGPHRDGFFIRGCFDDWPPTARDVVERRLLRRVAADGTRRWETESLGERPVVAVSPSGEIAVTPTKLYGNGSATLSCLTEDGKMQEIGKVNGSVSALYYEGESLVAEHALPGAGPTVTRWDFNRQVGPPRDGVVPGGIQVMDALSIPRDWLPQGWTPSGDLFLVDAQKHQAALLDWGSSAVVRLTDLSTDHSLERTGELQRLAETLPAAPEAPPTVVDNDYIVVGGIRIPRRAND